MVCRVLIKNDEKFTSNWNKIYGKGNSKKLLEKKSKSPWRIKKQADNNSNQVQEGNIVWKEKVLNVEF